MVCVFQAMNFPTQSTADFPSCTKAITIRLGDHTIKLKQAREVIVNEQEVTKLPFTAAGAYIHTISSIFLMGKCREVIVNEVTKLPFHIFM
jgi:von Willebrand factor type D domain.